jgi:hypothetical protein
VDAVSWEEWGAEYNSGTKDDGEAGVVLNCSVFFSVNKIRIRLSKIMIKPEIL